VGKGRVEWMDSCNKAAQMGGGLGGQRFRKPSCVDLLCANKWWQGLFLCSGDVVEVGKGGGEWVGGYGRVARAGGPGNKNAQKTDSVFTNEWRQGSFLHSGNVIDVGKGEVEWVGG
jgi:hypothetical protein